MIKKASQVVRRALKGGAAAADDFDPAFYRATNPDLAHLSDAALASHFNLTGAAEGRSGNGRVWLRRVEAEHGSLPDDFDGREYLRLHPDVAAAYPTEWEAGYHFLVAGRKEARAYREADPEFDAEFYRGLYRPGEALSEAELGAEHRAQPTAARRFGSLAQLLAHYDFQPGVWLDTLDASVFEVLNWTWCAPLQSKEQAVEAFLREGVDRLAPISLEVGFDPTYYRTAHDGLKDVADAELYREWLQVGLEEGTPGSAPEHLKQLGLNLQAFPRAFAWKRYAQANALGKDATRWDALKHFVEVGYPEDREVGLGAGAELLLAAIGARFAGQDDELAVTAYERAEAISRLNGADRQNLGDCYLRRGDWRRAYQVYSELAAAGEGDVFPIRNGAQAAMKIGRWDNAFEQLERGRAAYGGHPLWRKTLHEALEEQFRRQGEEARALYAEGERARADQLMTELVRRTAELIERLEPLPGVLPASDEAPVLILGNHDLKQCTHYRIHQKMELLKAAGRPFRVFDGAEAAEFIEALPGAGAAIFYRLPAWPDVIRAMLTARRLGVPTYYEIDDLVFNEAHFPPSFETYGGQLSEEAHDGMKFGVPLVRGAMRLCDYAIASTEPLAAAMEAEVRSGQAFVLRNGLDSHNEDALASPQKQTSSDELILFYGSGTLAHNSDFTDIAGPALIEILRRHAHVRLMIVGHLVLDDAFLPYADRILRFDLVSDIQAYWTILAEADINIAVLEASTFNDAKSEIKWLEAAALAIPSVVSRTATYESVLRDGEDVLMADDPGGWTDALEQLVTSPELRAEIGLKARAKALAGYSLQAGAAALSRLLAPADAPRRQASGKPRLLLVNTFFPPQTIGGATRVVRDNVDAWIASDALDGFDLAVVATDDGEPERGRLRFDSYRGVPVIRIGTPASVNGWWQAFDEVVGARFSGILELWKPDLVHFHAMQLLTASCAQACREAGTPYMITAHDAWWISDFQFLIDEEGRLRTPGETLTRTSGTGITSGASWLRRGKLKALLDAAVEVTAVSESFAEIYRRAGAPRTVAIPNGLPRLPSTRRTPSASGRVRLGHLGGLERHKGQYLVKAALGACDYGNLELTIVDHARSAGYESRTVWGSTPVRIIGKLPQDGVHALYAGLDVLLAPSIWPESYGLVAREALAAGLWVVASDLGAMGEDVEPGVNGFVVDVSRVAPLAEALAAIDADPARYLASPEHRAVVRSSADQAAELVAIYAERFRRREAPLPAPTVAAQGASLS